MAEIRNPQTKYVVLNNGQKLPRIGYGSFESIEYPLKAALKAGYRHIDTAKLYGNEETIGKVLKEAFSEGNLKREDIFITTKIWNDQKHDVETAVKESLARLQLDYIDLYLIHFPLGEIDFTTRKIKKQTPLHVTWKALEEQVKAGRVKSIGVSNFNVQLLLDLLSYAEIKPVCNQIEVNPYLTQEDLIRFCKKNDIEIIAYSPLGGNFAQFSDTPKFTASTLLEEPVLKELATKYNKTPGQIVLNWHLSRGYSVIPRSTSEVRIRGNFAADSFELSIEDHEKVSDLNKNLRTCDEKVLSNLGNIPLFA